MKKKIFRLIFTIFFAILLTFMIIKIMPGDPVNQLANELVIAKGISHEEAQRQAVEILNYDPNQGVLSQFIQFMDGLIHGDLGTSMRFQVPVKTIILNSIPWTLITAGTSMLLAFYYGTKLGLLATWKNNPKINGLIDIISSILGSIPDYVLGFLLLTIFSTNLGILPARGAYSSDVVVGLNFEFIFDVLKHSILPIAAMFLVYFANWVVNMRAVSTNIMNEDYIMYAKARGLKKKRIMKSYVRKNSILPMITSLGVSFSFLVGGAPLIENMFSYPGVGYYLNIAIGTRDYSLMQGMFFVIIMTVVVTNFLVEIGYAFIDPRVRRKNR